MVTPLHSKWAAGKARGARPEIPYISSLSELDDSTKPMESIQIDSNRNLEQLEFKLSLAFQRAQI